MNGCSIHAIFGDEEFGELQMVSWRLERDKALIHTLGSPDAKAIARGKRYISGACIFVVFNRDSLLDAMDRQGRSNVWLGRHETANYRRGGYGVNGLTDAGRASADIGGTATGGAGIIDVAQLNTPKQILDTLATPTRARLADQLLPFDITLVSASEYGNTSKMTIYGVEFVNESGGVSIDDVSVEKQMQFIARSISAWEAIDEWNTVGSTSQRVQHPLAGKQGAVGRGLGSNLGAAVGNRVGSNINNPSSVYGNPFVNGASSLGNSVANSGSPLAGTTRRN